MIVDNPVRVSPDVTFLPCSLSLWTGLGMKISLEVHAGCALLQAGSGGAPQSFLSHKQFSRGDKKALESQEMRPSPHP